jgi:hypothetical protein
MEWVQCSSCNGNGSRTQWVPCNWCSGGGTERNRNSESDMAWVECSWCYGRGGSESSETCAQCYGGGGSYQEVLTATACQYAEGSQNAGSYVEDYEGDEQWSKDELRDFRKIVLISLLLFISGLLLSIPFLFFPFFHFPFPRLFSVLLNFLGMVLVVLSIPGLVVGGRLAGDYFISRIRRRFFSQLL